MSLDRKGLKWNGWGLAGHDFELGDREDAFWDYIAAEIGRESLEAVAPIALEDLRLPASRLPRQARAELNDAVGAEHVRSDAYERAFHTYGKSFRDLIRIRRGEITSAPDAVVYPGDAAEVIRVIQIARAHRLAVVPYGGGSSVVGGVEALRGTGQQGVITLDTTRMNRVLDVDTISHTATIQAGMYGPALEAELSESGYTLSHYPQSFEFSTLGGWIAARGAGQQSNGYGAAAKWVVSARVATPEGELRTLSFPNSAAGPNLNHLIAGSEGTLGVITDATVQVHPLPEKRDYRGFLFKSFERGSDAVRALVQDEIGLSMIRLSDGPETEFYSTFAEIGKERSRVRRLADAALDRGGFGDGACVMLLGSEGSAGQVRIATAAATAICLRHGAIPLGTRPGDKWYEGRFEMPYLRDSMLTRGLGVETLETSTSWSNIANLHARVSAALTETIESFGNGGSLVMAHISHSYRTGASLYFTFGWPMTEGAELDEWQAIKVAAGRVLREHGGTISHHHGVGADHLPWMRDEKGGLGMAILSAAAAAVDPDRIMNPGKLFD